jgi:DNA-binding GntR family transcriptional regulator
MPIDDTYEKLKAMIYRRQLDAGERIVERKLASKLGVSRIPLREGMVRLESEGLIRSIPNSSSYIAAIGPKDLVEIYSMRLWLEPPATRLATLKPSGQLLRRLNILCGKMGEAVADEEFSRVDKYDYQFHHAIIEAAGHSRLLRAYDTAHIRIVGFYTDFLAQKAVEPNRLVREHQQIIRAIRRGDPDRSEKVAREHVERSIANFEKKMGITLEPPVAAMS